MERVIVFDTTLRDGEQAPGCSMQLNEKLAVAKQLEKLGVDIIEAGFPVASPGDFEAVEAIAGIIEHATVCGLSRARREDIEVCAKALAPAKKKRIHTFIATSPIHMQHKLKLTEDEVIEKAVDAITYARTFTDDVEFSCEDASRSEVDFLQRICEAAIQAGATTINLPDTVGYALPSSYGAFVQSVIAGVPSHEKAIFSVHCHNDLGMAVANTLAAIESGARQIEVSVNGIGERAGNTALEEVVMALHTRKEHFRVETQIQTKEIFPTAQLVSRTTHMPIPANKAIVGKNAFLHESGIHQDGVLKERSTYEIMNPKDIGIGHKNLVLGKHSGRHAFAKHLESLGFNLTQEELETTFEAFKRLCDQKKEIHDADLIALVASEDLKRIGTYHLEHLQVTSVVGILSMAAIKLVKGEASIEISALGQGPVDAIYAAIDTCIKEALPDGITLLDYRIDALTPGQDAQADVVVHARYGSFDVTGRGISTSVLEASARAYVDAINHILTLEHWK